MRKVITVLLVLITFVTSTQIAEAASIIEKTSSVFSEPRKHDGKIRIDVKPGTVKYLRHAKYTSKDQKTAVQVAQVKGDKITGFAYNCPGYYLTRAYSDSAGTKLVGYVRVQVVSGDVTTKGCPAVSEAKPSQPPPVINKTHPIPEVDEPKNMVKDGQDYNDGSTGGGTKPPTENPKETPVYLNEKQQCDLHNRNGVTSWEIKWADKHTNGAMPGPHCVDMSECMYTDKWYCKAPSEPPKTAEDDGATGVPPREQYSELIDQEDFGSCGIGDTIKNNAVTSQCIGGGATSPPGEDGGTENGGEGGKDEGGACGELCKIFECPGWKEYLGTLYDVASFAVGTVEAPPVPELERPSMPNIFDILNDVEQRNPTKPTGEDGIGNTHFDATDVKSNAPEIPVREDPTGGFNIVDPMTTLPEDGSTAPKPEGEKLKYPGGSGKPLEGVPKPSQNYDGKVERPKDPGGKAKPPDDPGGKLKHPIP